jgi:hypothetical protein
MNTPIAFFVYDRPRHTRLALEALQRNHFATETDLHIFSDAAKTPSADCRVMEVRRYLRSIDGFRSVTVTERESNFGLSRSIVDGVSHIVARYGRVCVVEDDLVTSPFFLNYINSALDTYRDDDQVISVHGYTYPVEGNLPETFFLRGADCWGWGTWKRGWDLFEPDGRKLQEELLRRGLAWRFNFDGAIDYMLMLESQIAGQIDSWAIRWNASAFVKDKLTLYPGRSLVQNIGNDFSGRHTGRTHRFATVLSDGPIAIERILIKENPEARDLIVRFFKVTRPHAFFRLAARLVRLVRKIWVRPG